MPRIQYEEEIVERQMVKSIIVPKYVDVPTVQKRYIEIPVERIEEEIIEIPKVRC